MSRPEKRVIRNARLYYVINKKFILFYPVLEQSIVNIVLVYVTSNQAHVYQKAEMQVFKMKSKRTQEPIQSDPHQVPNTKGTDRQIRKRQPHNEQMASRVSSLGQNIKFKSPNWTKKKNK